MNCGPVNSVTQNLTAHKGFVSISMTLHYGHYITHMILKGKKNVEVMMCPYSTEAETRSSFEGKCDIKSTEFCQPRHYFNIQRCYT